MPQFMISLIPLKTRIATLVAQYAGIPFPSNTLWQSSMNALIHTSPLTTIISAETSDGTGALPILKCLKASNISSLNTPSISFCTVSAV